MSERASEQIDLMNRSALVSIVLPTFNRANMLAEGLESIAQQTLQDWELIVVDDGSTDRNREVVEAFQNRVKQRVQYRYQQNSGPGVARQQGIEQAAAPFIAFMDSDDPWFPNHLQVSVDALQQHPDVDWVVAPSRVINELTAEVVHENSFCPHGERREMYELQREERGPLQVIVDPRFLEHVIVKRFPGGNQASVLRRWIIENVRFRPYRLFDDVAFHIEAVAAGARVGFFETPQITYRIHAENTSLVNQNDSTVEKRISAFTDGIAIFDELARAANFDARQRRMLRRHVASLRFWQLGYNTYLKSGRRAEAMLEFQAGLKQHPLEWRMWKTYLRHQFFPW